MSARDAYAAKALAPGSAKRLRGNVLVRVVHPDGVGAMTAARVTWRVMPVASNFIELARSR
jgi:hypothetical protein